MDWLSASIYFPALMPAPSLSDTIIIKLIVKLCGADFKIQYGSVIRSRACGQHWRCTH